MTRFLATSLGAVLWLATPQAHAANDWQAPQRLVRFDDVEADGVKAFEDARRAWVANVRAGKAEAGDGLALVWSGTDGGHTHYLLSSPFTRFADLDAYRDLQGGSEGVAGDAYADAPHRLQVWRRIDGLSFPSATMPGLNELTAGAARIEIVTEKDARKRADLVATWKDIAAALASEKYPLASIVYENRFVDGQLVRIWLAKDMMTLKGTPPVKTTVAWSVGEGKAKALSVRVNQLTEMDRYYFVERRAELSTTGP